MAVHDQDAAMKPPPSRDDEFDLSPTEALSSTPIDINPQPSSNRFAKWDSCAAIRSKPRQRLSARGLGTTADLLFFNPELVPVSRHPLVVGANLSRKILLQHLYSYLWFTTVLEQQFVNPVMIRIATGALGLSIPSPMLLDAHRIYCDEGYHALCSVDLSQQVEELTGIASLVDQALPKPFRDLTALVEQAPQRLKKTIELSFVIVSETLVSAILTRSHLDVRVAPAIRQVILEHAQDEAIHQAYFSDLTKMIWPQIDAGLRREIGVLIPELILTFLRPDLQHVTKVLTAYGVAPQDAQRVAGECYPQESVVTSSRLASSFTTSLFRSVGAFDDPIVLDAFHRSGLLIPEPMTSP
jgi:hypothetical protein